MKRGLTLGAAIVVLIVVVVVYSSASSHSPHPRASPASSPHGAPVGGGTHDHPPHRQLSNEKQPQPQSGHRDQQVHYDPHNCPALSPPKPNLKECPAEGTGRMAVASCGKDLPFRMRSVPICYSA